MKSFQCAICLEPHLPTTRKFAIHCGHVFCEACIKGFVASKRAQHQPIICPSCRASFVDQPPYMIELYLEYEDDDRAGAASGSGSSSNPVAITARDKQQMTEIIAEIDNLGVESSRKELEGVIAKGEMLSLRLQSDVADDATKTTLDSIMTTLEGLRSRLVYAQRLASLKSANEKAIAENRTTKASLDALLIKYRKAKGVVKRRQDALNEALARESSLALAKRLEGEKVLKQLASAAAAKDSVVKELDELKAALKAEKKTSLKWHKRYEAKKAEVISQENRHGRSVITIEDTDDDSLEVLPPGATEYKLVKPNGLGALNAAKRLLQSTQPATGSTKRKADDDIHEEGMMGTSGGGDAWKQGNPAGRRHSVLDLTNSDDLDVMGATPAKVVGKQLLSQHLRNNSRRLD
ncbi:hypothetical protein FRB94_006584 [Tulasnella sp. JGI-2019a]|nr:hypothetical protein FRB93_012075 [Tulasnella sp. JGI-2019a]KAG9012216.1 hypothetical protein FRB94_006584 [Tulasnella sp. JGI-2019a]KAG9036323.1 hypothetical protein FRB95_009245 [Tulasnella sp. JGI-2019a]